MKYQRSREGRCTTTFCHSQHKLCHKSPLFTPTHLFSSWPSEGCNVFYMPCNTFFFKFRKLQVIIYGLVCIKCILFEKKNDFQVKFSKERKICVPHLFQAALHTFLLFSCFTHELQFVGYDKLGVLQNLQLKINIFLVRDTEIAFDLPEGL